MKVNPINVINLLLTTFQTLRIENSELNEAERQLSSQLKIVLLDAMNEHYSIDVEMEESLDFQEQFKDINARIIEDQHLHHLQDPPESPTEECTKDGEQLDFEYKRRAVEYWRTGKKKI